MLCVPWFTAAPSAPALSAARDCCPRFCRRPRRALQQEMVASPWGCYNVRMGIGCIAPWHWPHSMFRGLPCASGRQSPAVAQVEKSLSTSGSPRPQRVTGACVCQAGRLSSEGSTPRAALALCGATYRGTVACGTSTSCSVERLSSVQKTPPFSMWNVDLPHAQAKKALVSCTHCALC